ncbi:ATP-binding protein [Kitasatospora sp. RB6PN24]|uniref:ATP-binding protein n=1 Tax=Kitasatospora humi TaxID=2893891 RepID=UPI001E38AF9D|nr:ATP-binding protein [Kitasatospora humi]MCC9307261.1 ATP-binding protein [Kitasatospora humi]
MPGTQLTTLTATSATSTPSPAAHLLPALPRHWRFPAEPASVPRARRALSDALPDHCPAQLAYELRLLATELVTNAVRHGADPDEDELIELSFWIADGHYWLAVSDPSPTRPVLKRPAPDTETGRGLLLVESLSDAWGVKSRPTRGKSVIAGIRLATP